MDTNFKQRWKWQWQYKPFRQWLIAGFALLLPILCFFPIFFNLIEQRQGYSINDWLLKQFQPQNTSVVIFIVIWATALLVLIRSIQQPSILLVFLWGYILLSFLRMISITLIPLNPPATLLELKDPLSNAFYGSKFITKDLFFSGHTSTMFLICLCLQKKMDKIWSLLSTIIVGVLVLVQHVHYTIDVLAAPPFTFLVFLAAQKLTAKPLKSLP